MSFVDAMRVTRREERGLANDPDDPGGRTFDGVAEHANPEAWRDGVCTEEELLGAYKSRWQAIRGDSLPPATALALFDWYFQSGAHAVRALQRLVGAAADGVVGVETIANVGAKVLLDAEDRALAMALVEARAAFLGAWVCARPVKPAAGVGWEPARIRFLVGFMRRLARISHAIATEG
jgi:lysozyme family protein